MKDVDLCGPGTKCPYNKSISLIGNKWMLLIIREFMRSKKPMRFNAILDDLKPVSSKTLSSKLKELARLKIIRKQIISTTPIIATYQLTEKGKDLANVLESMKKWIVKWHD